MSRCDERLKTRVEEHVSHTLGLFIQFIMNQQKEKAKDKIYMFIINQFWVVLFIYLL